MISKHARLAEASRRAALGAGNAVLRLARAVTGRRAGADAADVPASGAAHAVLVIPLLALGTVLLWGTLALTGLPTGAAQIALFAAVVFAGTAIIASLSQRLHSTGEQGELARFHALGDKLEKGIEKLKDLQWELSDNETRYRDLLDSQNDIITRVDSQGRLTFVNRAFCRTFGIEAGAVLGTPFAPEVLQHEGDCSDPPEPGRRHRFEQLVITADGARWFAFEQHAITAEPTDGVKGRVREIQLLGRDVTEQRRTQAALAEARDQAEAANRAKSRFLAAMSHEIRTPMNGILGMTSLLSETALSAEQRSYVEAVDYSAKNLLTIIDEILDLSKIEAGKLEIHPAPFPLDECVQSVIELLAPRAREKSLDMAWRLDPDLPKIVIGDETRVRQILLNLLGNAIKFTDQGGVALRLRRVPALASASDGKITSLAVEMEVTDSGAGIAPERARVLFAEFEQADDVVRRKRSGSGLGLAISRRLAQAMDGDISFDSTPGQGSTFRAKIVLKVAETSRRALPLIAEPSVRRVLVVSDRLQSRVLIQEILKSVGVSCEVADKRLAVGLAARARRELAPFDTVVADAEIGLDTIASLIAAAKAPSSRPPRTILVVDHPGGSRLDAFRTVGCDAYLVWPVRPSSLLTQLELGAPPEPVSRALELATERPAPAAILADRTRSILLVEDNDINALLARRMSERAGCAVHHASSGPAALSHCDALLADPTSVLDVVLMDIHMPDMDGFEAARRIKRLFAARGRIAPPIVALTANAFAEDRKRCLEAGLDDYLAKPFERAELEALLEKWCQARPSTRDGSLGGAAA